MVNQMDPEDDEYHSYDDEDVNPYILESLEYEYLMEEYFRIVSGQDETK